MNFMNKLTKLKILVVEDDAIVAQDLVDCLLELGHCPLGPAYEIGTAKKLFTDYAVDLVLLDIHLEGQEDGILLASWIREERQIPIIFLTAYSDYTTLSKVKKVFPDYFLVKPFNKIQLKAALEITANNFYHPHPRHDATTKAMLLNQQFNHVLTKREIDIVLLVCQGLSNQQISDTLFVSTNTIKTHLKNVFIKTESNSRANLISKMLQF